MMFLLSRWDWLVLGWVTAMGQKERNENFSIPSLLSCGVALKSANCFQLHERHVRQQLDSIGPHI